jgi:hypothetical protein
VDSASASSKCAVIAASGDVAAISACRAAAAAVEPSGDAAGCRFYELHIRVPANAVFDVLVSPRRLVALVSDASWLAIVVAVVVALVVSLCVANE